MKLSLGCKQGKRKIDAELSAKLGQYFNMSEGFFFRLQNNVDKQKGTSLLN